MRIQLDIATIIFVLILGHLCSCILAVIYMVQHKKDSAFRIFILAKLFSIIGLTLMLVPGTSGNVIMTAVSNVSVIIAEALQISAFLRAKGYQGKKVRWGYSLVAATAVSLFFLISLYFFPTDTGIRVAGISILCAILWAYPIYMLIKGKDSTLLHHVVAFIYALELIPLLLRAYLGLQMRGNMSLMENHPFNTLFFALLLPVMLVGNSGFILMSKERSDFELTRAATYDELTNIYNRRTFLLHAQESIAMCTKKQSYLSFFMIDLDYFKRINDLYGHKLGDEVLVHFTSLCKAQLREYDLVGRLGGEEFAVLFAGLDETAAIEVAERLRRAVQESHVDAGQNRVIRYTVSIGAVTLIPDEDTTLEMLYKWSDDALYTAKARGRNCVQPAQLTAPQEWPVQRE